jgi:hypothetical protein
VIDLDAVIAAEVRGDPIEVKVGKKTYKLQAGDAVDDGRS